MRYLIPSFILLKAKQKIFQGSFDGYVLNIDIKGFTALTQDLMSQSETGVEVISDVINTIFTPSIEVIERYGGFVSGFAGDAFTAIFINDEAEGIIKSSIEIRDFFIHSGIQKTEFGDFELTVKIGVAKGLVSWQILPSSEQTGFWFSGNGIEQAILAQEKAEPNQIIIEHTLISDDIENRIHVSNLFEQFSILENSEISAETFTISRSKQSQKDFVPEVVLNLQLEGEFREVLSCFISLCCLNEDYIRTIILLCKKYGGYFNKVDCTDKGWLALVLFGAPLMYEKTSERAMDFAIEIQALCGSTMRIGMSYGKAFAGFIGSKHRGEYTALGMSVNLGARYTMRANWGEILFDSRILKDVEKEINYHDLGMITYKGFNNQIPTYKLIGVRASVVKFIYSNKFVGRQNELQQLIDSCTSLFDNKFAGVTYIYGEAGQGKSRLVYELEQALGDKVQFIYLQCDGILKGALNPFIYWIKQKFTSGILGTKSERIVDFRDRWFKFTKMIEVSTSNMENLDQTLINRQVKELNRIESIIAGLIGLDWDGSIFANLSPKDRPAVMFTALKSLLETYCLSKPVILILEDLHWIDIDSVTAFQVLTRQSKTAPLKLVVTSRFNDDYSKPSLTLDCDVNLDSIDLSGWNIDDMVVFATDILKTSPDESLKTYLFSQTQGNPFFAEQLCYYLIESERLILQNGKYHLIDTQASVPINVQGLLVARLDRLEASLKVTVQTASVLGREFTVNILLDLLKQLHRKDWLPDNLHKHLTDGERGHIWNTLSEITYIFIHSLLRDTAYTMQLKKQLKKLHLLTAEIMERNFSSDKTKLEEIAVHFDNAGEWEKAIAFYNKAGDFERGQFHFVQSLNSFDSALQLNITHKGERHPDVASSLNSIGVVYYTKSDYSSALQSHLKALSIRNEALGVRHLDSATSLINIGNVFFDKGEYDKALEYDLKALSIRQETLGEKHPDTASCLNNIANIYITMGNFEKAQEYYLKALEIWQEKLGNQHPDTASCLNNIGNVLTEKGDYNKALEYYLQALSIRQETLGIRHPNTAYSLISVGTIYDRSGDYDTALKYYLQALSIWLDTLGERHPRTAHILSGIGSVYDCKGEFEEALKYNLQALSIQQETLGDRHPNSAFILSSIGSIYKNIGDCDTSLKYHLLALSIRQETLGEKHPDTASNFHNIGCVYDDKGDYDKALEYFQKAFSIYQDILKGRHPNIAFSLNAIGGIYSKKGEFVTALEYYFKALSFWQESLIGGRPNIASTLFNIGEVYNFKGDYSKSSEYYLQALSIFKETMGEKHPYTILVLNNLADTYEKMGNRKKATEYRVLVSDFSC